MPSGSTARKTIGLARSLAVMTGDTIRAEVYAKYLDPDPSNWTAALHDLMAAIAGGTAPTGTVIEAVPPFGSDGFPFAGLLDAAKAGDTGTRAYLNILLVDENLTFVDGAFVPVTTAAMENGTNVPHEKLSQEIVVQQPGFVYIYLSNDNGQPLEVFFDDFTVEHVHSAIVQADDYYPFGMTFNEYRREDGMMNKYLYNGKELQNELGLETYAYEFRMYDPALGRWWQHDPIIKEHESPYAWVTNNPVLYMDLYGLDTFLVDSRGRFSEEALPDKENEHDVIVKVSNKERKKGEINYKKDGSLRGRHESLDVEKDAFTLKDGKWSGDGQLGDISNAETGKEIFEFLANNTSVEWSYIASLDNAFNIDINIYTSHIYDREIFGASIANDLAKKGVNVISHIHSHPKGDVTPSLYDISFKNKLLNYGNPILFSIYSAGKLRGYESDK